MGYRPVDPAFRELAMHFKKDGVMMSNVELAEAFGVAESTIRYWKGREGKPDLRRERPNGVEQHHAVIQAWMDAQASRRRTGTMKDLYAHLNRIEGFEVGYDAVRRYVARHWQDWKKVSTYQRIETPPGILTLIDWKEDVPIRLGNWDNLINVQLFFAELSFSRHTAVVVSLEKGMDAFLRCHNAAWIRLGGLTQWVRTDCLATAVTKWNGQFSVINATYKKYLDNLGGLKAFPSRPGTPEDKGKVEKKIRDVMAAINVEGQVWTDLEQLQQALDQGIATMETSIRSGATGLPVSDSWALEKKALKPLPENLPVDALRQSWCLVRKDGTVTFGKNFYQVPHSLVGERVLCVQTATRIQILHHGELIDSWEVLDQATGMVRLSAKVMQNPINPLSPLTKAWAEETAIRQVEFYQSIIGGQSS